MSLEGKTAPDFTLPRDGGGEITLSALRPSKVILYFYPKDDTSGCTKEAIDFSEAKTAFEAAGAVVVGISKDPAAKHDKFIAKHALDVILASDAEGSVCETYGTWIEKQMYGKKYMGIERTTYLIDGSGIVVRAWRKVKVVGHVDDVLAATKGI